MTDGDGSARLRTAGAALLLVGLALLLLLPYALQAGLHLDDHGFHRVLQDPGAGTLLDRFLGYVPGRNLYILYYAAMYRFLGPDPSALHAFGVFLDALNPVLLLLLLRQAGAPLWAALAAGGLALVWPNHHETHFWTSAIAMNLLSTTFLLAAFLALGSSRLPLAARPWLAAALYLAALFDYDQAFFMWAPLAFYGARLAPPPRPRVGGLAAVCFAATAAHALLRAFAPLSEGGRPTIQLWRLPIGAARAAFESLVPLRRLPEADGAQLLLAAVAAAAWLAAVVWLRRREEDGAPRAWLWGAFGALFAACAYLPMLFWYLSPRHNYLPSLGLAVAVAALAAASRRGRLAAPLGGLFFALSAAALRADGKDWADSAAALRAFSQRAPALVPEGAARLFLVGAPSSVGAAPAFRHPHEPLNLLGQASGRYLDDGDLAVTPTERGTFLGNRVDLFGRSFRWAPWKGSSVLGWTPEGPRPVCALALRRPDGAESRLELRGAAEPGCAEHAQEALVWLASSSVDRAAAAASPDGWPELESAALRPRDGYAELVLVWRGSSGGRDFAAAATLEDQAGRAVWTGEAPEPSDRHERRKRRLVPLFNDRRPASGWTAGSRVSEVWQLRGAPRAARVRLTLYRAEASSAWAPVTTRAADFVD